jgi:hypothetical protein
MGGEEAKASLSVKKVEYRKRTDVYAVIIIGKLNAGKHSADKRTLSRACLTYDTDELIKGREIELGELHSEGIHTVVSSRCKIAAEYM